MSQAMNMNKVSSIVTAVALTIALGSAAKAADCCGPIKTGPATTAKLNKVAAKEFEAKPAYKHSR